MFQFKTAREAAALIPDGATVAVNSFLMLCNPAELHSGIAERFAEEGHPRDLTLFCAAGFGGWDEERFAEPYVKAGAVRRVIAGHYMSMPAVMRMAAENRIEAYNLPLGVLSHCIRAAAAGEKGCLSRIGLGTFVDPATGEGPALNAISKDSMVEAVEFAGERYLYYRTPKIDVALIKGTTVDPNGNITFEDECVVVDALSLAQATKANGGIVIVQIDRVNHEFARPRKVVIPGMLVDYVVVRDSAKIRRENWRHTLSGDIHVPPSHMDYWISQIGLSGKRSAEPNEAAEIIGERAARELRAGQVVNIGVGIPETIGRYASKMGILKDLVLTVEAGGVGGLPAPGISFGATIGADMICDMASQFDFYDGGGLDICFMGGFEVDSRGNVNAHNVEGRFAGIGGFINITTATPIVVFCMNFTAKGLSVSRSADGSVRIEREGTLRKFKRNIRSISFSAQNALARGQRVLYVTERCVFELTENGLKLTEVYPGIDAKTQILDLLDF